MSCKVLFPLILIGIWVGLCNEVQAQVEHPNIIVIFADDLGYGDLGSFGHPTIRTPNLDQMAQEGLRFTQFYVGADVCTPSRAALLTGRLPIRFGLAGTKKRDVFFPNSAEGLPTDELTIPELLKSEDYSTAILGKWHLGHTHDYLPPNHGFDYYFGIPYSNDMTPEDNPNYPPLPLYRNYEVIESGVDQSALTKRYTSEAISFIKEHKEGPFFLYYPNNFPHVPLVASEGFRGKSKRGIYGDVVTELDWSVGEIIRTLRELNIEKNTLVIFTSDNGPWLLFKEHGGSAGPLYEGKGSAYEGGMRVPAIFWWPGTIKGDQVTSSVGSTLDLLPTFMSLAGVDMPADREYDGFDLSPLLLDNPAREIREVMYYYHQSTLYAVRKGKWKAHFITKPSYSKEEPKRHTTPLLYQIEIDPSEKYDVAADHPEVVEDLTRIYQTQLSSIEPPASRMDAIIE